MYFLYVQSDAVANHPNLWFQTSVNYHKLKSGKSISTNTASTEGSAATSGTPGPEPIQDGIQMSAEEEL